MLIFANIHRTFPAPQMVSWDPKERFCVIGWRTHSFIYQLKYVSFISLTPPTFRTHSFIYQLKYVSFISLTPSTFRTHSFIYQLKYVSFITNS